MKCYYNCCQSEEQKPHVVKHGVRDGIQRYRCLNCKRTFIQQNELKVPKVRKNKGLKDYEKYIIDQLVNESVPYRAVYDCTGIKTSLRTSSNVVKHYSKLCIRSILRMFSHATHIQKKLNEVLEKFKMKFMELN